MSQLLVELIHSVSDLPRNAHRLTQSIILLAFFTIDFLLLHTRPTGISFDPLVRKVLSYEGASFVHGVCLGLLWLLLIDITIFLAVKRTQDIIDSTEFFKRVQNLLNY